MASPFLPLAQDPRFVILNCFCLPIGNDPSGWICEEEWAIIGIWDQFQHENMHSYFFSLNLVILKPRIYSQLRYLQSLGNQFGKKTKLRMWCTFCVKIAKSHGFVTCGGCIWMRPILLVHKDETREND